MERRKRGLFGLGILPVEPLPLFRRQELGKPITGELERVLSLVDDVEAILTSAGNELEAVERFLRGGALLFARDSLSVAMDKVKAATTNLEVIIAHIDSVLEKRRR